MIKMKFRKSILVFFRNDKTVLFYVIRRGLHFFNIVFKHRYLGDTSNIISFEMLYSFEASFYDI